MNQAETVESAERDYQRLLEVFFIKIWGDIVLSSHDIVHHRRVWCYGRELYKKILQTGSYNLTFPAHKLLIACYLHDLGMTVSTGTEHGIHSMNLCSKFLTMNNLPLSDYTDLLSAIEHHDQKDYRSPGKPGDLITLLSVADDLDAFGFIGIYRYMEIFLKRGILPEKAGTLIRNNATKRFNNFLQVFGFMNDLISIHKRRFEILDKFLADYDKQLTGCSSDNKDSADYCGVINLISNGVRGNMSIDGLLNMYFENNNDPVISWFFRNLKEESKSDIQNE